MSGLIVKVKQFRVLSQCIENNFANFHEEVQAWHYSGFFLDLRVLRVGHEHEVFWVEFAITTKESKILG